MFDHRSFQMTIGGLENIMARRACSQPTTWNGITSVLDLVFAEYDMRLAVY
jgi:hypothetical protein